MTRRKEVSEKSLELNVCSEMLQCLRTYRHYRKALWVGLTQREEREQGLDEKIRNARGLALLLQFKSPWATFYDDNRYRFSINKKQHEALESLGGSDGVFYVFPLYNRWRKADAHAPNLLQDTWLLPIACISTTQLIRESTPIEVIRRKDLRVQIRGFPGWEATCEATSANEYFKRDIHETAYRPRFIPLTMLKEWIEFSRLSALRFRHLGFFHLPHPQLGENRWDAL